MRIGEHDERRCPTPHGCLCNCTDCITHCGLQDRDAAWFCVTQGIAPVDNAIRAARGCLDSFARAGFAPDLAGLTVFVEGGWHGTRES